jgi:hypothetical protein
VAAMIPVEEFIGKLIFKIKACSARPQKKSDHKNTDDHLHGAACFTQAGTSCASAENFYMQDRIEPVGFLHELRANPGE